MQNYFKTMPNHPRSILKAFLINHKHFIFFSHFYHFFTPGTSTSSRVKPYLKVYRGANPPACALALMCLRHRKSQKYMLICEKSNFSQKISSKSEKCMLIRKKSNFSQKTHQKIYKGPSDPGSPGTSISYYSFCMS